jgi:hypothetical protein
LIHQSFTAEINKDSRNELIKIWSTFKHRFATLVERGVDNGTRGDSQKYVASPLGAPQEQGLAGDGEAMRLPTVLKKTGMAVPLVMELGVSSYTKVKINTEGVLYHEE